VDTWKRFGEKELSHSMVHYLQAVAGLKAEKGYARVGDVASRLGVSKSGVTSMMRSLQGRGLVDHEPYGCVELTSVGQKLAERTESIRHVLHVFLTEILGVPEAVAEEDACMIEHLVSPQVMIELVRLTTFMRSEDPAAADFRAAFQTSPRGCPEHSPDDCDLCAITCLQRALVREARRGSGSK
jgi:Mn-dependent DtxR family transcriptional regulator